MSSPPRLRICHLSKTFGSIRVLSGVDLTINPGEVHGLAGQNGSGKSTLIKLITGYHPADPGAEYAVDGHPIGQPVRWREVHRLGVSVVHQDLGLIDDLSVAENICVGGYPQTGHTRRIDRRERDLLAARTLARLGVDLPPRGLVGELSAAQRAEVAVARGLRDQVPGSGLLILDESTRTLSGADLDRFHAILRRLASEGTSILMITHSLPEMLAVTDRITVLRDGQVVGASLVTSEIDEREIARRMLGKAVPNIATATPRPTESVGIAATVTGLAGKRLRAIDFEVRQGEILGITGLPGSGYEEIPYLLSGARRARAGTLRLGADSVDLSRTSVYACMRAGVAMVPERREQEGLAFELSARDNLSAPLLRRRGRPWFVGTRWQNAQFEQAAETLDIRPRQPGLLIRQFSGGNQQKVLLGKWLSLGPKLLILHEPMQAVDVGARLEILQAVRRTAGSGSTVLLVSSEPSDLVAACGRILVYRPDGTLLETRPSNEDALIEQIYAPVAVG